MGRLFAPLALSLIFFASLSPQASTSEWDFMGDTFIAGPEKESSKHTAVVRNVVLAVSTLVSALWVKQKTINDVRQYVDSIRHEDVNSLFSSITSSLAYNTIGPIIVLLLPTILSHKLAKSHFNKKETFSVFKDLIITWKNNKQFVPEPLHSMLERIHTQYSQSASDEYLYNVYPETTERIIEAVIKNSPTYAKKIKKESKKSYLTTAGLTILGIALFVKLVTGSVRDLVEIKNLCDQARPQDAPFIPETHVTHDDDGEADIYGGSEAGTGGGNWEAPNRSDGDLIASEYDALERRFTGDGSD